MTVWKRTNRAKKTIKCSDLPRILGRKVRVEEVIFFSGDETVLCHTVMVDT